MSDMQTVCIAGKNNIAVDIAQYILNYHPDRKLIIIVNRTDDGQDGWQRSLKKFAFDHKIATVALEEVYKREKLLFLSLEFDRIIDPNQFVTERLFNIHFSCLPKYKGMYTAVWPILNGESQSGVTLHKIDAGIDTGDIVDQQCFDIEENDTARDLYFKCLKHGTAVVERNIPALLDAAEIETHPQQPAQSSYYAMGSIDFSNVVIDLRQTAANIHDQIRAYSFREYQLPTVFGHKIASSEILKDRSHGKPGKVLSEDANTLCLSTIDFNLLLLKDRSEELFEACKNGDAATVNELLHYLSDPDIQNVHGWTPLIVAAYNNHLEIVEALLKKGADILKTNFKGTTPLMYAKNAAVASGEMKILELMHSHGADISQKDDQGLTVLDYCEQDAQHEVIDYLNSLYR